MEERRKENFKGYKFKVNNLEGHISIVKPKKREGRYKDEAR